MENLTAEHGDREMATRIARALLSAFRTALLPPGVPSAARLFVARARLERRGREQSRGNRSLVRQDFVIVETVLDPAPGLCHAIPQLG